MKIEELHKLLSGYRYAFASEAELQAGIAIILKSKNIPYDREFRLNETDRPDFFIGGIAVEVKIKGSQASVLRQVSRYSLEPRVKSILLVSSKMQHVMPQMMNGKSIFRVHVNSL